MLRPILLAAVLTALSGCATWRGAERGTSPDATQAAAWQARGAQLRQVDRFVFQGRIASGALGFKADLRWKQQADGRFAMRLSGPFGAGAAELSGDAQWVQVRTGDEPPRMTADPEAWLEQALGVRLPINGLRWWALGLPAPDSAHEVELDARGRARLLSQNGWELHYPEYRAAGAHDLPRRIEARNGDTRVLVLADAWSDLGSGDAPVSPTPLSVEPN